MTSNDGLDALFDDSNDPLRPRATDPGTSQLGLDQIPSLKEAVLRAAGSLPPGWTDDDLKKQFEYEQRRQIDRGLLARTRYSVEKNQLVRRLPLREGDRRLRFVTVTGRDS